MYKNVCLLGKGLCLCVNLFASSIYCTGFYTECFGKKTKFFFFFPPEVLFTLQRSFLFFLSQHSFSTDLAVCKGGSHVETETGLHLSWTHSPVLKPKVQGRPCSYGHVAYWSTETKKTRKEEMISRIFP